MTFLPLLVTRLVLAAFFLLFLAFGSLSMSMFLFLAAVATLAMATVALAVTCNQSKMKEYKCQLLNVHFKKKKVYLPLRNISELQILKLKKIWNYCNTTLLSKVIPCLSPWQRGSYSQAGSRSADAGRTCSSFYTNCHHTSPALSWEPAMASLATFV